MPQAFDFSDLPISLRHQHDGVAFVLNRIIRATEWKNRQALPVAISTTVLNRFIHKDHTPEILKCLLSMGIIETSGTYVPGLKSRTYRLTSYFRGKTREYVPTNPRLLQKLEAQRTVHLPEWSPSVQHLFKSLDRVSIDKVSALEAANKRLMSSKYITPHRKSVYLACIEELGSTPMLLNVDPQGRVYSPVSTLIREARPFLKLDGEGVCEIDVVSSQPTFLFMLLKQVVSTFPHLPYSSPPEPSQLTFAHEVEALGRLLAADFYEAIGRGAQLDWKRDQLKREILTILYGNPRSKWFPQHPINHYLCVQFPQVWGWIKMRKETAKGPKAHGIIARELQRAEASFVIETVVPRLAREHPSVPLVTVHDSLIVPRSFGPEAQRVMEEEFHRLGVPGRVRLKTDSQPEEHALL